MRVRNSFLRRVFYAVRKINKNLDSDDPITPTLEDCEGTIL